MKIRFHGAAQTVTGSCHILEVNGSTLLLDCGLYQGRRKLAFERNRSFPLPPAQVDAVVLSHAHIDHSGNLPTLVKNGFNGRIITTKATADLCSWMLRDSAHIQEKDVEFVNRRRRKQKKNLFEPLYTHADARAALALFHGVDYNRETEVVPGVKVTFQDAGHILGSASCHLRIVEGTQERTLVFTGDVGRTGQPILRDPIPPQRADILICESTYGDRLHGPRAEVAGTLAEVVKSTITRGGKVLIPAFSVGRTQRIVYHLHELFESDQLPRIPIFVDSPLSANVTEVFRAHPECYDRDALDYLDGEQDPLGFYHLTYVRDVEASKALNGLWMPCVIIAASGMCEAGRILHHLKNNCSDRRNTILIVGFMAEHTLGRKIANEEPRIKIFGDEYTLSARVERIEGLSAHADRDELLGYLGELERPPAQTFLVHGERTPAEALGEKLRERGFPRVEVPAPGQEFRL